MTDDKLGAMGALTKQPLTGISYHSLQQLLIDMGETPYRAAQIFHWVYKRKIGQFLEMTNVSRSLREFLEDTYELASFRGVRHAVSSDGTIKYWFTLSDGRTVESVYIPEASRSTLCISSQVGCVLKCAFCCTGQMGFYRNLKVYEIVNQVLWVSRDIGRQPTNIVFMGMGEPLLNYTNVMTAIDIFLHKDGFNFAPRKITLSTVGLFDKMKSMPLPVSLAISLHSAEEEIRRKIVPISRHYPISYIMKKLKGYPRGRREVFTFEYVMLDQVNDSWDDAMKLAQLIRGIPAKVNLIPFNPIPGIPFQCSPMDRVEAFKSFLNRKGIVCTIRKSRGRDINAACGQLGEFHLSASEKVIFQ